jgi:hypothetical protein
MRRLIQQFIVVSGFVAACAGFVSPAAAQVAAVWATDSAPGTQWTTTPIVVAGQPNFLYMVGTAGPPSTNYEGWLGTPAGVDSWTLTPMPLRGVALDLLGTWTITGLGTAQLQVASCTSCGPFSPGTTHDFEQLFAAGSAPPTPPDTIQSGLWEGQTSNYDVCFNVSQDGRSLTPAGSQCGASGGESYDVNFFSGLVGDCGDEDADVDFDGTVPIINNRFESSVSVGIFNTSLRVEGTFADGVLTGTLFVSFLGNECTGEFTATPAQ